MSSITLGIQNVFQENARGLISGAFSAALYDPSPHIPHHEIDHLAGGRDFSAVMMRCNSGGLWVAAPVDDSSPVIGKPMIGKFMIGTGYHLTPAHEQLEAAFSQSDQGVYAGCEPQHVAALEHFAKSYLY